MELVIFRLAQECLTNVHRRSGGNTASIRVVRPPEGVTCRVEDQGKKMAPERLAEVRSRGTDVGIRAMRERVRQFNGEMH
jgi:signal transduction histidine kinase